MSSSNKSRRGSRSSSNVVLGRYELLAKLGSGSFATVYRGRDSQTKASVAIKLVPLSNTESKVKYLENLQCEVEAMRQIGSHPNIVRLLDEGKTEHYYILVLEFCGGGDIKQLIEKIGHLPEIIVKKFASDLAAGLACLRKNNILHRDLKPGNLLLTTRDLAQAQLKIADFGFAREVIGDAMMETLCGTPLYMAPELLNHEKYDAKADLWSVGTILFEMVTGKPPFTGGNYIDLAKNIEKGELVFPANLNLSEHCVSLLRSLLKRHPNERISYEDFFAHPFIQPEPEDEDKDDGFVAIDESDLDMYPKSAQKSISGKLSASPEEVKTSMSRSSNATPPTQGVVFNATNRQRYRAQMSFVNASEAEDLIKKLIQRSVAVHRSAEDHLIESEKSLGDGRGERSMSMDENEMFFSESERKEVDLERENVVAFSLYLESIVILKDCLDLLTDWRSAAVISFQQASKNSNIGEIILKIDNLTREALKRYNDVVVKAGALKELIESEGMEKTSIDTIEKILYDKALKYGGGGAVDEMMQDHSSASKKYEQSCLILSHLREGFPMDAIDSKVLDSYIGSFNSRIKTIDARKS